MGAAISSPDVFNNKNWAKCNLAADIHLRNNLVEILHNANNAFGNYLGLPSDPKDLFNFFNNHKGQIKKRSQKSKKGDLVVFDDQYDLLFPADKQTQISKMDITLIGSIIKKFLPGHLIAVIDQALKLRNDLKHGTLDDFKTEQQADTKIQDIRNYLVQMKYSRLKDFEDTVKDDKFIFETEEAKDYASTIVAELKRDLTDHIDVKIDHNRKLFFAEIIKELKPRLKGLSKYF